MASILKEAAFMRQRTTSRKAKGFTLLETMIALVVLAVGILGLAAMLGNSLAYMQASQDDFIAQQKAEQAVEAIFTAKYTSSITWAQVSNFGVGNPTGLFLAPPQPLLQPGPDGLLGSVNDVAAPPDYILQPGPDGKLGTADDIKLPLSNFTRTITITNSLTDPNLRTINVTINYQTGRFTRQYSLNTLISAFD
jgi:prepilin-type N-terminal cleavage/methylation domain-containing protein